jgi:hypothetical protein
MAMTGTIEPREIRPPSWLSRPEKRVFVCLINSKMVSGKPVSTAEIDLVADLVAARSRIATLMRMWRRATADADGYPPSERHALALARQLDTTVTLSRRLARELGLD